MFWKLYSFYYLCKTNEQYERKKNIYEKSDSKSCSPNSNLVYHHLYRWINIKCYFYPKLDFLKKCLTSEKNYLTLSNNNSESSLKILVTETV